jgi:hypothetical protein
MGGAMLVFRHLMSNLSSASRNTGKTPGVDALFPCPGSGKPDSSYV